MRHHVLLTAAMAVAGSLFATTGTAATAGLWLFDNNQDVNGPDPGGLTFYDQTPNASNFVTTQDFGTITSTADRPAIITTGQALSSVAGGASLPTTPSSDRFSRGKTGALTVEFWVKYISPPASVAGYVMSFGGGSSATRNNEWGIYGTPTGSLQFFDYENGGTGPYPEVGSGALDGNWHHVAFTIDAANTMKSYVDGGAVGTNTAAPVFGGAVSDVLKWGRSHDDGWAAHGFLIDELRISDVALLPGNGNGDGVLAWNASLVPEPSALAGAALLALGLRRRRQ